MLSRISFPYPGAIHVAPPATKVEREYRTRSPQRRNRRSGGVVRGSRKPLGVLDFYFYFLTDELTPDQSGLSQDCSKD